MPADSSIEEKRLKKLAQARAWKAANREKVKSDRAAYYAANKEKEREQNRSWRKENPERARELGQEWSMRNRDKLNARARSKHVRDRNSVRQRERYRIDPSYRVRCCLRASLTQALRLGRAGKKCSVFDLIGCDTDSLMRHLERQFDRTMSWNNYADVWVIDHITPCASFNLSILSEQKACFHFTNLRPLCRVRNQQKSDRIELLL